MSTNRQIGVIMKTIKYRKKIILLVLAIILGVSGCKSKGNTESTKTPEVTAEATKATYEFPDPVLCDEFSIPEGYFVLKISTTADNQRAYVSIVENEENEKNFIKVLYFEKEGEAWGEPKELTSEEEMLFSYASISRDGKRLIAAGNTAKEYEKYIEKEEQFEAKLYIMDVEGATVNKIEEVKVDSTNGFKILPYCNEKDEIFYVAAENFQMEDSSMYCARLQNGAYVSEKIELALADGESIIGFSILPDNKGMILNTYHEAEGFLYYYYSYKNETYVKEKTLQVGEDTKTFAYVSVSGDGELVYLLDMDAGAVYKISTEALKNKEQTISSAEPYKGSVYDEFDTSDFALQLRNKTDKKKKEGIYYEIFVRSFADSDGDGIGDLNGVTKKLDYLQDLGVDGIWLMPINASPSYHGYDVTDYNKLNEEYGTEKDLEKLLKEAHKRDMKVIMDFVINHTSDQHPWFQEASKGEENAYRNYYRWVMPEDTKDFNVQDQSPWNSNVWYKKGNAYYYSLFYGSMPDLNYNNPKVREEIKTSAKKWLEMGMDGFRLDAAMHIYGNHEFKQQKDQLASNIQWWNEFARYCEGVNPDVYLVGEAWQEEEALAEYVQPFDTKFNFTLEHDLMEAIKKEKAVSAKGEALARSLQDLLEEYAAADSNYLDGIFGSNHDQDRIMSQVKSEEKAKLIANIYLTLPGNPYLYYGEELGMLGAKPDEKIREPFKWTENGKGMDTTWEKNTSNQKTAALEKQKNQRNSMYQHYKRIIKARKQSAALTSGTYEAIDLENDSIMAYKRVYKGKTVLVFHNLSAKPMNFSYPEARKGKVIFSSSKKTKLVKEKVTVEAYGSIVIQE